MKTGQCGKLDPVDDVAATEPGRAEQPVDQVAERAAEQRAERDRPAVERSRRAVRAITTTTTDRDGT